MNAFKKSLIATSMALTLPVLSTSVQAFETSANVTLTSDYKFRGISQTDRKPAIQGGFDLAFDNGLYVGTWGSNVDFAGSLELDMYFGYAGNITEDVGFDIGYLYYDYPGADRERIEYAPGRFTSVKDDYQELYGSLSYKGGTLGFAYSDDYYLESGKYWYLYGAYDFELPHGFTLGLHAGYNDLDYADDDNNPKDAARAFLTDGEDSYWDYAITLGKTMHGLDFTLSWIDTDLSTSECFDDNLCKGSLVLAVSKSL
jgi:uncharacterized protein (TIGR02001 family)